MWYGVLADLTLLVHLGFVLFVSLGAVAVFFHPRLALLHVPSVIYGAGIELVGWVCPLTPFEQRLRRLAGQQGYSGGFIEHYVGGWLYPADWETLRIWLGGALIAGNLVLYCLLILRLRRSRQSG
jgi:hypothetical protein